MKTISTWLASLRTHTAQNRAAKLAKQAEQVIQVREFNGGLYLCFAGVPLVCHKDVSEALEAVKQARVIYANYYKSKE